MKRFTTEQEMRIRKALKALREGSWTDQDAEVMTSITRYKRLYVGDPIEIEMSFECIRKDVDVETWRGTPVFALQEVLARFKERDYADPLDPSKALADPEDPWLTEFTEKERLCVIWLRRQNILRSYDPDTIFEKIKGEPGIFWRRDIQKFETALAKDKELRSQDMDGEPGIRAAYGELYYHANVPLSSPILTPSPAPAPASLSGSVRDQVAELVNLHPGLDSATGQHAFVSAAGLDRNLVSQLNIGGPRAVFISLFVSQIISWGRLSDGRHAVGATLKVVKSSVGANYGVLVDAFLAEHSEFV